MGKHEFVFNEERAKNYYGGLVYTNDIYELSIVDNSAYLHDINHDEILENKACAEGKEHPTVFDHWYTKMLPTIKCWLAERNGIQDEITVSENFGEVVSFEKMKEHGGIWTDVYESILEADKVVRSLYSDKCIVQTEEDVAQYLSGEEEKEKKLEEMVMNAYYEDLRNRGYDVDGNTEMPFDVGEDFAEFFTKWKQTHRDLYN